MANDNPAATPADLTAFRDREPELDSEGLKDELITSLDSISTI